jgi:hypothetical protein
MDFWERKLRTGGSCHGHPEHYHLPDQGDTEHDGAALRLLRACCTSYPEAARTVLPFVNAPLAFQRPILERMEAITDAARLTAARAALLDDPPAPAEDAPRPDTNQAGKEQAEGTDAGHDQNGAGQAAGESPELVEEEQAAEDMTDRQRLIPETRRVGPSVPPASAGPRPKGRDMAQQSGPLHAYYDELRSVEEDWYRRHFQEGRTFGVSLWDTHLDMLREIDSRHGIQPEDPRVYSISAYLEERWEIDEDWLRLCQKSQWLDMPNTAPDFPHFWAAQGRHWARLDDCRARHFPGCFGLRSSTVDTGPKLWAHIRLHRLVVRELVGGERGSQARGRPHVCEADVQEVYSLMHRLQIPWVPSPPYPGFTKEEATDELVRIANRLEQEDAERYQQALSGGWGKGVGEGKPRGGKRPLEETNPVAFQVYQRIRQEHRPGRRYADTIDRLKTDHQFTEQVKEAGLKLNSKLVKAALVLFDQRERDAARKKQETDPT